MSTSEQMPSNIRNNGTPLYKRIIGLCFVMIPSAALPHYTSRIHPQIPPIAATIPWFLLMAIGSKSKNKLSNFFFSSMFCTYYGITIYSICWILNYLISNYINNRYDSYKSPNISYKYALLWIYSPIIAFESFNKDYFIWRLWLKLWWNYPLLFAMKLTNTIFGTNPFGEFISIISNNIAVSCLPQSQYDVNIMYNEPYQIRAVINMCIETKGPIELYKKYGIEYIHLPTFDLSQPTIQHCQKGIEFIQKFVKNRNKDKERVLIHCCAGKGRSATMALCWLIIGEDMNVQDAFKQLKDSRSAVVDHVITYKAVQHFAQQKSLK